MVSFDKTTTSRPTVGLRKPLKYYLLLYAAGYVLLIALLGVAGGAGLYLWHESSRETLRINSMMQQAQALRGNLYRQLKEVFDSIFLADESAAREYREYQANIDATLVQLAQTARSDEERAAVERLRASHERLDARGLAILRASADMSLAEQQRTLNTELEAQGLRDHERAIDALENLLRLEQTALDSRLSNLNRLAPLLLALPIFIGLALLAMSRLFLRRAVVAPLSEIERAARAISHGDLGMRVPERGPAELVSLAQAINRTAADLAASRASLLRAEKQAALGALVPVLAHNIRNPIASIRATAQVLNDASASDEVREDMEGIISTADRLERWTAALLSYLHPVTPRFAACDLVAALDAVLDLSRRRLADKGLSVTREGFDANIELSADVELVEQALHGLIVNAIDASPHGGTIAVALSCNDNEATIVIRDEGAGIPFTPAARDLSPGPTTKRYGTGLGIPFALKVIEQHNGRARFEKCSPKGTVVTIILPRKSEELPHAA
jgi:signal transduction histidine kinase